MTTIERSVFIEATPEAVTAVSYTLEYTLSNGVEGQAMDKLITERANEISIEQSLYKLKALIEGK